MKVIIEIECEAAPNPATLNHLIALLENPNNRNSITIREEEV